MRLSREVLLLLFIGSIMSLGMNLVNALRSLYIQSLGATVLQVSIVIALTGVVGTVLRLPSGLLSDRYGRHRIIGLSVILACVPPVLYTLSAQWFDVIPWGIIYSVAFALYMPSRMAIVADYTPTEHLIRVYSLLNLAWPIGSILGPTLSGLLENQYGWHAVFYVATILHSLAILPALVLPDPSTSTTEHRRRSSRLDRAFLAPLLPFFLFNVCIGLGIGSVESITPIYLIESFQISTTDVGLFLSIGFGVTTLVTQIPAGFLAEKVGKKRFLTLCVTFLPPLFLIWPFIDHLLVLLLLQMAINGLWSMTWPAFLSLLMDKASPARRGITTSLTQMGMMTGFTLGPYIGGYLWDTVGLTFPYFASALFCALCVVSTRFITDTKDHKN
jgi:MFS family permease